MPSEMKRLPALEEENGKQAEESRVGPVLDKAMPQGMIRRRFKACRPGQMVDYLSKTCRASRSMSLLSAAIERSTCHYRARRAGQAQLTGRIKEIAASRGRYDYRRIHGLLRRDQLPEKPHALQ
jgi:hypothetical protein